MENFGGLVPSVYGPGVGSKAMPHYCEYARAISQAFADINVEISVPTPPRDMNNFPLIENSNIYTLLAT